MLSLSAGPDTPRPRPSANHDAMSGWADTVNSNVAPRGRFALAHNCPLCASIIDRQIDSRSPKPSGFVLEKSANTRATSADGGDEDLMTSANGTLRTSRDVRLESG